jgi:hypothetical protein
VTCCSHPLVLVAGVSGSIPGEGAMLAPVGGARVNGRKTTMTRGRRNITICHGCACCAANGECGCGSEYHGGTCKCFRNLPHVFVAVGDELDEGSYVCAGCGEKTEDYQYWEEKFYHAEILRAPKYFVRLWQKIPGTPPGVPVPVTSLKEGMSRVHEFRATIEDGEPDVMGIISPIGNLGVTLYYLAVGPRGGLHWK